ncbi:MAG: hypothetical protein RPU39_00350 [Candidatus Sedimenticola sp. (ex Thyasira tokunagai)]
MPESDDKYISNSQQRILTIMMHLGGHETHGLAPGEISKSLNISPANVTHDLANLKYRGLADRIPNTNRWRLLPSLVQLSTAMLHNVGRKRAELDEIVQRYTRTPY